MNIDGFDRLTPSCAIRLGRRQGLMTLLALGLDPAGVRHVSARQTAAETTLLVRGEAELVPGSRVAWRVVQDVAEVGPMASFEERALGFAVASSPFSNLLFTDEETGSSYRLAPGEAAFVTEGTSQRRESLEEQGVSYLRIGLVEATHGNDAGGDRLRFGGPAFLAPSGPVTLALHRVEPEEGEKVGLPAGAGETLLLVEQGEVELEVGEAAERERLLTVVGSDTAYAIRSVASAATLFGGPPGTRVLIATIF
jgi:hypothetical protein